MKESYGFEIEFCSHDNTMLRYTHVTLAKTTITGHGVLHHVPLSLETDSSDVLELVTPPLIFATSAGAKRFKDRLANFIVTSVDNAISLEDWLTARWHNDEGGVLRFIRLEYFANRNHGEDDEANHLAGDDNWVFAYDHPNIAAIKAEINVNNIDDGINVAAAQYWQGRDAYNLAAVKSNTILSPSMKDYAEDQDRNVLPGFSTQTSLPMTAAAYVNYILASKYTKAKTRLGVILDNSIVNDDRFIGLKWSKVDRWLGSWFWHGVTVLAWERVALAWNKTTGLDNTVNGNITALRDALNIEDDRVNTKLNADALVTVTNFADLDHPQEFTANQRTISFIAIQKIISGALGGLSERAQLAAQQDAHDHHISSRLEPLEWVRQDNDDVWKEYHSSLKDLNGIWFKGWLKDVAQQMAAESVALSPHLAVLNTPMWKAILRQHYLLLDEVCDRHNYKTSPSLIHLSNEQLDTLAEALNTVTGATRAMLLTANNDDFNNPPAYEGDHEFLEYSNDIRWEGRKDTLIRPIAGTVTLPRPTAAFLVEHRNN